MHRSLCSYLFIKILQGVTHALFRKVTYIGRDEVLEERGVAPGKTPQRPSYRDLRELFLLIHHACTERLDAGTTGTVRGDLDDHYHRRTGPPYMAYILPRRTGFSTRFSVCSDDRTQHPGTRSISGDSGRISVSWRAGLPTWVVAPSTTHQRKSAPARTAFSAPASQFRCACSSQRATRDLSKCQDP